MTTATTPVAPSPSAPAAVAVGFRASIPHPRAAAAAAEPAAQDDDDSNGPRVGNGNNNNDSSAADFADRGPVDEDSVANRTKLIGNDDSVEASIVDHTDDFGDDDAGGVDFVDHFSLGRPSSAVRFRGAKIRVYGAGADQFLLEERLRTKTTTWGARSCSGGGGGASNDDDDDNGNGNGKSRGRCGRKKATVNTVITVKRMGWSGFGLRMLRLAYALISLLLVGFAFVLCFQIILFIFVQMPVQSGATELQDEGYGIDIIGALLSVPVFLYGMASLMSLGAAFVADAWDGGPLARAVFGASQITSEVVYFAFFVLVPSLALIITLMAGYGDPWQQMCYAWVISVTIVFCAFMLGVVFREVQACFDLLEIHPDGDDVGGAGTGWEAVARRARRAALLSQRQRYSGYRHERYMVSGEDVPPPGGYSNSPNYRPQWVRLSLYSRFTQLGCLRGRVYDAVDPPARLYTTDEVRDVLPFVTAQSWSLESMFCRSGGGNGRAILSARGPSALTRPQVMSSIACNVGGALIVSLVFVGLLVWVQAGTVFYVAAALICIVCCLLPMATSGRAVMAMYSEINAAGREGENGEACYAAAQQSSHANVSSTWLIHGAWPSEGEAETPADEEGGRSGEIGLSENEADEKTAEEGANGYDQEGEPTRAKGKKVPEETTMFQLWETVRVAQPKEWCCYANMVLEVSFLFIWPLCALLIGKNYPVAVVFVIVAVFTFVRKYFDPANVLSELGSMSSIDIERKPGELTHRLSRASPGEPTNGPGRTLVVKSRLSKIVGYVTRSTSVGRWMWFFGTMLVLVLLLFLSATNSDDIQPGERSPIVLVDDFYYPTEESLQYPTCQLSKGFMIPSTNSPDGEGTTFLGDYAFLSALAYERTKVTDYILPQWFGGEGLVVDEDEFVRRYRAVSGTVKIPVYFKLFTVPSVPDLGLVAIRGSQTMWDWLVNMQLWSAAGLAQVVKWATPYGWIWTPVLDELVSFVDFIQGESLKKVSYYTVTSGFINAVLAGYGNTTIERMRVTGASLGGGLAIITGAQTGAAAVAISGLGAELSRHTLDPPVTVEQINERVFNFIPDRDIIARIGGRPRQHQEAQCTAPNSDFFGCHSMWRSVCEINYRCGTNGRPVICRCVQRFGYPAPLPIGDATRTFEEACAEQEQAFLEGTAQDQAKQ